MFNLFKKKEEPQPQSSAGLFSDLTQNQRMSVINLLALIAYGDDEGSRSETALLSKYSNQLGVRAEASISYMEETGYETMISDLNKLNREQKKFLVLVSNNLIGSDGEINQEEVAAVAGYFGDLGIDMDEYISIVEASLRR
ncbi:hypothetical protein A3860_36500 [Niastella vici]|uniref:Co-chaperone DjlA N-terminal domain-containing protein n=1 Tax=Niastella vici TaxID=1703345 RepID=A0A1V9FMU3_9BACT|nr:hypothetical protein [Niastella vici]OQP59673.1 hypothetical protein A3860_36500 [Niastella vici]